MPDKPYLLASTIHSQRVRDRMAAHWTPVLMEEVDLDAWIDRNGTGVRGIAPFGHRVDGALMDRLPNLGVVSNYGVGYDNIDARAAAERGVIATNTPGVLNDEVANTAILLLLAVYRDAINQEAYLRAGRWAAEGNAPLTRGIAGSTVGIVGLGRIGKAIAEKLAVFGVTVVYHSRTPRDVDWRYYPDLVAMAGDADALIAITPGGAGTAGLISREVMAALGPQGTLINVARGSVVDEPAMIDALRDGNLGWAGLDVFADEPHVPAELIAMKNVVLLPHVGSATVETRQAMGDLVCDNLDLWLAGGRCLTPVPECAHLQN